jgi:hypothetical protein
MNTTYLRFPSQDVWKQAATTVGVLSVVDGEEQWSYYTHDWAVDDVGVIYNDDGVYSDDGEVITPPTPMDGWHVNYKAATLPSDLEAYVVTPNSPHRKFAGE